MTGEPLLREAAQVLALALVREEPTGEESARFEDAVRVQAPELVSPRDRALWKTALRGPGWTRLVDAGLAFADPYSPVRHRICLMLAILEASPHHARRFLPARWSLATPFEVGVAGTLGVLRVMVGLLMVRSYGVLWR